jgi:hypothetical protein
MNDARRRYRLLLVAAVLCAELGHLAWEQLHGGVRSHHLLNRADLPAIHNAWGLLLLPALAWFLIGRTQARLAKQPAQTTAVAGFAAAMALGLLLAGLFTLGQEELTTYVFEGLFVLAVLLPVYRAECVLGFVLGMAVVFGAVLPTVIATLIAALSALLHKVAYPLLLRGWSRVKTVGGAGRH